jgi:2-oxoglutarate dehydrogenase E1 component
MRRGFRKPLIVMTPKSLLRHKEAVSPLSDLVQGHFQEILDDDTDAAKVRRLVLCSGKVFYDLRAHRAKQADATVALIRVEQFYPFAEEVLVGIMSRYKKTKECFWVQEESQNMGGWSFMEPRLRALGYEPREAAFQASASHLVRSSAGRHKRKPS